MPDWKDYEGQVLDGKYPLERYVSGDDESALFLIASVPATVRVRRADAAHAEAWVHRWNRARVLADPHLLRIDRTGISVLAGGPVAYLVMEHADENLGEILAQRSLTPEEAREMLIQVAGTLVYLHIRGLAHGDVRPSNIFAMGNTVKLSSEQVGEGDPAEDIRALGFTLIHALTQRAEAVSRDDSDPAAGLPAPFGEIATGCLHPDPKLRWTADQVVIRLRSPEGTEASRPNSATRADQPLPAKPMLRRFAGPAVAAAAGVAIVGGVMMRRTDGPAPAIREPRQESAAVAPQPGPAVVPAAPKTAAPVRPKAKAESTADRLAIEDGITQRVMPKVPEKARNTITGRPAVVIRVIVGPTGDVTEAAVERTFSPYFSKLAVDAARQWKFASQEGAGPREWMLRFEFTHTNTRVVVQKAIRK